MKFPFFKIFFYEKLFVSIHTNFFLLEHLSEQALALVFGKSYMSSATRHMAPLLCSLKFKSRIS